MKYNNKALPVRAFGSGSPDLATGSDGPATVVVGCSVRKGHEAHYEAAVVRLTEACQLMPGYLGATVRRPAPGTRDREYSTIFRFDSKASLQRFETSEPYADFVAEVRVHLVGRPERREITGLEFWFQPTPAKAASRANWRMTLVTLVVVYGLVLVLSHVADVLLPGEPLWVRMLAAVVVQTLLMSYWLMPRVTHWLAGWLQPRGGA